MSVGSDEGGEGEFPGSPTELNYRQMNKFFDQLELGWLQGKFQVTTLPSKGCAYLFPSGKVGAMSLAEVENMATLQPFTLGGSGGSSPRKFDVLTCILVHSEAYREAHMQCFLGRVSSS